MVYVLLFYYFVYIKKRRCYYSSNFFLYTKINMSKKYFPYVGKNDFGIFLVKVVFT